MKQILLLTGFILGSFSNCIAQYTISTFAGAGWSGYSGDGGQAMAAAMNYPHKVASDKAGNIYIADYNNNAIRKVDATTGTITTIPNLTLNSPRGVALDTLGNIYIADYGSRRILKVNAVTGISSVIAGTGTSGSTGDGGLATAATFIRPQALTVDRNGNVYVADKDANNVRKITAATGIISTVAGTTAGFSGDGGPAVNAQLSYPRALTTDKAGNLYISDYANAAVRKVNTAGIISTIAGRGTGGNADGIPATGATLIYTDALLVDNSGNVYITDGGTNLVRRIDAATGFIYTIAGNGSAAFSGDGGPATAAGINPTGITMTGNGTIYIADYFNYRIRKLTSLVSSVNSDINAFVNGQVYPNPVADKLILGYGKGFKGTAEFYSLAGQLVKKAALTSGHSEIPVNDIPAGTYFLKIISSKEEQTQRIVIQH